VVVPADRGLTLWGLVWLPEGRIVYMRSESPGITSDDNLWQIGVDNNTGTPTTKPKRITQGLGLISLGHSAPVPMGIWRS
jgi:hypothetical protein